MSKYIYEDSMFNFDYFEDNTSLDDYNNSLNENYPVCIKIRSNSLPKRKDIQKNIDSLKSMNILLRNTFEHLFIVEDYKIPLYFYNAGKNSEYNTTDLMYKQMIDDETLTRHQFIDSAKNNNLYESPEYVSIYVQLDLKVDSFSDFMIFLHKLCVRINGIFKKVYGSRVYATALNFYCTKDMQNVDFYSDDMKFKEIGMNTNSDFHSSWLSSGSIKQLMNEEKRPITTSTAAEIKKIMEYILPGVKVSSATISNFFIKDAVTDFKQVELDILDILGINPKTNRSIELTKDEMGEIHVTIPENVDIKAENFDVTKVKLYNAKKTDFNNCLYHMHFHVKGSYCFHFKERKQIELMKMILSEVNLLKIIISSVTLNKYNGLIFEDLKDNDIKKLEIITRLYSSYGLHNLNVILPHIITKGEAEYTGNEYKEAKTNLKITNPYN